MFYWITHKNYLLCLDFCSLKDSVELVPQNFNEMQNQFNPLYVQFIYHLIRYPYQPQ